jgi:hypothetical protein
VKKGERQHKVQIPFPWWNDSSKFDAWKEYVAKNYSLEHGLKTIYLDSIFARDIYEVGPISHLNAGIMPADLALLKGLASNFDNCTYFEITKRRSEAIDNMASVASECYALTRPAGEMRRKGVRNKYMYMLGSYSKALNNVAILTGDSHTFDFTTLGKKFDIIFINSGHGYNRVLTDTRKTFEYLVHDESIVVWHDYSYFPEKIRYEVLAGILEGLDPINREQLFFVSQTKCAIFLRAKYQDLG